MAKKVQVTVDTRNLLKRLGIYSNKKGVEVKNLVKASSLNIEREAKKLVPVDKAILKTSIRILSEALGGMSIAIGTDVVYGPYIEFTTPTGTGPHGGPKPFLFPALEGERPAFEKRLRMIFKKF